MTRRQAVAILAATWIVVIALAYPGVMTMDSFDQLKEARAWFFTDAHPPAMAALWGVLDRAVAGPLPMLILQTAAFIAGLFLILRRVLPERSAAIATAAVTLFPPVLAPMLVIWKDCQMAGFLVLGIAGLLADRRLYKGLGLAAIVVATAMRYNAPAATLPLVVLLLDRRILVGIAGWIVATVLAFGLNKALVDQPMYFWNSSLALGDIVGVVANAGDLPDAELAPLLAPTQIRVDHDLQRAIRAKYKPYDFQQLVSGEGLLWDVPLAGTAPAPAPQRAAIAHAWWELLTSHPLAWTRYRFAAFAETIGLVWHFHGQTAVPHRAQYPGMVEYMHAGSMGYGFQRPFERALVWTTKHTPLFRPFLYLVLAVAVAWLARRQRDALAIVASGIVMELSLWPLVQTPDYRYSHWLVVTSLVACVMVVVRRRAAV